ncbi:MAG: hypothetical protein CVU84_13840 [Firmicutes bacterium HGW-Firmicutes-1]|jgi:flagellar protein FliS|nr:MAG: hypothetical protein CVU84_13840 [Firmicutes bacterium HGW-Firmicutes-1]
MNDTMVKDFQNKIVNAGKADLLLINYEMLFVTIDEALQAIEEEREEAFNKLLSQANRLLRELSDNLDFNYDISKDLMAIYIYVSKQLIDASITFSKDPILGAKTVLNTLYTGWLQASTKEEKQKPMVMNGQKIYAGLTYGKDKLNEMVYDGVVSRGFRA